MKKIKWTEGPKKTVKPTFKAKNTKPLKDCGHMTKGRAKAYK